MKPEAETEPGRRGARRGPAAASEPSLIARARTFITRDIWRPDEEGPNARAGTRLLRRAGRVVYCTVLGFTSQRRSFHAAALTYFSALSIVPFLALSFALVKGLGGYRALVDDVIHPWIAGTFSGNRPLQQALDQLLSFVQQTNVTTLGGVGLVTLVYGAVSLLSTIEQAFNDIWGVTQSRPLLRRTTNYITLIVLTPLLAIVATALATATQSSALMARFEALPGIGHLVRFGLRLSSLVIAMLAFGALYLIMPNTRVRLSAASIGAAVSGILWQLALLLYVNSQRAITGYSAVYSGFSAIPVFFVWMYVSWTIVLAGAELASSYQHEAVIRQRRRARDADQSFRERLAVQIMAEVGAAFLRRGARWTAESLARELRAPVQVTAEAIGDLARARLVLLAGEGDLPEVAMATDLDGVRVSDILQACRHRTHTPEDSPALERELIAPTGPIVDALDDEIAHSDHNLSVRHLAAMARERSAEVEAVRH